MITLHHGIDGHPPFHAQNKVIIPWGKINCNDYENEFILDIKVKLNSSVIINRKMQIINKQDLGKRYTCYLCRTYSSLNHGDDYNTAKPVIQIRLLDFTLYQEHPEFNAANKINK